MIQQTELEVDSIDDLVLVLNGSEQTDMLRRIGSCRKIVMQLLRLLGPKADVVRSLIKRYEDKTKEIEIINKRRQLIQKNTSNNNTNHFNNSNNNLNENKSSHEIVLFLGDIQGNIYYLNYIIIPFIYIFNFNLLIISIFFRSYSNYVTKCKPF